ncbi:unnamed protein product [Amoebophrya sp. A120]|nr:unnamed protein product [Amoebophrya sp. A120]|eukprot:GSA120T00015578001.1
MSTSSSSNTSSHSSPSVTSSGGSSETDADDTKSEGAADTSYRPLTGVQDLHNFPSNEDVVLAGGSSPTTLPGGARTTAAAASSTSTHLTTSPLKIPVPAGASREEMKHSMQKLLPHIVPSSPQTNALLSPRQQLMTHGHTLKREDFESLQKEMLRLKHENQQLSRQLQKVPELLEANRAKVAAGFISQPLGAGVVTTAGGTTTATSSRGRADPSMIVPSAMIAAPPPKVIEKRKILMVHQDRDSSSSSAANQQAAVELDELRKEKVESEKKNRELELEVRELQEKLHTMQEVYQAGLVSQEQEAMQMAREHYRNIEKEREQEKRNKLRRGSCSADVPSAAVDESSTTSVAAAPPAAQDAQSGQETSKRIDEASGVTTTPAKTEESNEALSSRDLLEVVVDTPQEPGCGSENQSVAADRKAASANLLGTPLLEVREERHDTEADLPPGSTNAASASTSPSTTAETSCTAASSATNTAGIVAAASGTAASMPQEQQEKDHEQLELPAAQGVLDGDQHPVSMNLHSSSSGAEKSSSSSADKETLQKPPPEDSSTAAPAEDVALVAGAATEKAATEKGATSSTSSSGAKPTPSKSSTAIKQDETSTLNQDREKDRGTSPSPSASEAVLEHKLRIRTLETELFRANEVLEMQTKQLRRLAQRVAEQEGTTTGGNKGGQSSSSSSKAMKTNGANNNPAGGEHGRADPPPPHQQNPSSTSLHQLKLKALEQQNEQLQQQVREQQEQMRENFVLKTTVASSENSLRSLKQQVWKLSKQKAELSSTVSRWEQERSRMLQEDFLARVMRGVESLQVQTLAQQQLKAARATGTANTSEEMITTAGGALHGGLEDEAAQKTIASSPPPLLSQNRGRGSELSGGIGFVQFSPLAELEEFSLQALTRVVGDPRPPLFQQSEGDNRSAGLLAPTKTSNMTSAKDNNIAIAHDAGDNPNTPSSAAEVEALRAALEEANVACDRQKQRDAKTIEDLKSLVESLKTQVRGLQEAKNQLHSSVVLQQRESSVVAGASVPPPPPPTLSATSRRAVSVSPQKTVTATSIADNPAASSSSLTTSATVTTAGPQLRPSTAPTSPRASSSTPDEAALSTSTDLAVDQDLPVAPYLQNSEHLLEMRRRFQNFVSQSSASAATSLAHASTTFQTANFTALNRSLQPLLNPPAVAVNKRLEAENSDLKNELLELRQILATTTEDNLRLRDDLKVFTEEIRRREGLAGSGAPSRV